MTLEDFQYIGTNITGFRIVDESAKDFSEIVSDWRSGALSGKPVDIDPIQYAKVRFTILFFILV